MGGEKEQRKSARAERSSPSGKEADQDEKGQECKTRENIQIQFSLEGVGDLERQKGNRRDVLIRIQLRLITSDRAKLRNGRAIQGAELIWGRLMRPKRTTPIPPERGVDKEAIEHAQGWPAQTKLTREKKSGYSARIASRRHGDIRYEISFRI